ncbi:MAG TPA: hypothetical protein VGE67_19670 [Haloferula sp.]
MKPPSIKELARSVGASENSLYRWQREGVDIRNPEALRRRAGDMPDRFDPPQPKPFGRRLREVIENMPLELIDEIEAATDRRGRFTPLCRWVGAALRELGMHDHCPDGLLLTPEEAEAARQYREQMKREESGE